MAADDSIIIADRYTSALFALAKDAGALAAVESDMQALKAALTANSELEQFLASPLYNRAQKAAAMDAVLEKGKAHALTRQFVKRLALNLRLSALPQMIARFEALLAAENGEMTVEAISAKDLSDAQYKELSAALSRAYGRKVKLSTDVDPDLLGGLVIKVGSTMIDYSLKSQLNRLAAQLKTNIAAA